MLCKSKHFLLVSSRCQNIPCLFVRAFSNTGKLCTSYQPQKEDDSSHDLRVLPPLKKKDKLEPFVKNLFIGKFDKSALVYPEALCKERHETLHDMIPSVEKLFLEEINSSEIDRTGHIPPEVLDKLKALGLYGMQIPEEYGGLGLGATEYSRLQEIIAMDGGVGVTINAHQAIGFKGLLLAGSDYLKEKYLPLLATGELTAAFCLTEANSGSDAASIQTRATLAEDGKTWLLNGTKMFISNGGTADVMTVFARTEVDGQDKITAFFVERAFGGVTSGPPEDKMGIRGSNTTEVHFDNTPVPSENIIGELGRGFKLAVTILNSGRFSMGSATAGVLKRCIGYAMDHAIHRKQFGMALTQFGLIKEKFARVAVNVYAMESMSYLVAGFIDGYEEHDTAVEAAIVKVFSSQMGWVLGSELLQVMGGLGYMRSFPYERFLRDGRITLIFEGTNEILRLFIALMGIQHASPHLKEYVKKIRNPLFHPAFAMRAMFTHRRDVNDNPRLTRDLKGHLHPSLESSANDLEYCIERLRFAVQCVLKRYGADVVQPQYQMDLARLGDMAIDVFAMTAVLARSSRSYCIGLHNSDHEILLAQTFCREAKLRIQKCMDEVEYRSHSFDTEYTKIADALIAKGGYAAEHPLTMNVW